MEVADRVVVMSQGNIEQADGPSGARMVEPSPFAGVYGEVNRLRVIRGRQFHVSSSPPGYTRHTRGRWTCSCARGKWYISRRTSGISPLPVQVRRPVRDSSVSRPASG